MTYKGCVATKGKVRRHCPPHLTMFTTFIRIRGPFVRSSFWAILCAFLAILKKSWSLGLIYKLKKRLKSQNSERFFLGTLKKRRIIQNSERFFEGSQTSPSILLNLST